MDDSCQKIGILLIDGFALMSYASIIEPLRAANMISHKMSYDIRQFSTSDQELTASSSGALVRTSPLLDVDPEALDCSYLFVVAGGDPFAFDDAATFAWLRRLARTGITLVGVSGGPVLLAKAGLMQGYQMTVHWEHEERLKHDYPELDINRTLYVMDRSRMTCAGGTAPSDMMHALIADHYGRDFARNVSDWYLHTDIRADIGQQKSGIIERYKTNNRAVIHAIEAMETHIIDPLNQEQIARFSGVSTRQLQRIFMQEIDLPPMSFYRNLRLDHAAKLLEHTSSKITEIAFATGFSSSSHFSEKFFKRFQMTPQTYRSNRHSDTKSPKEIESETS